MLKTTITKDEFTALDEILQKEYETNSDPNKYNLNLEGDSKLKTALSSERQKTSQLTSQSNSLQKQLDSINTMGMSIEEISELVANRDKAKLEQSENQGKWKQAESQLNEIHKRQMGEKSTRIKDLESVVKKERISTSAINICTKIGVPSKPILDRLSIIAKMDEKTLDVTLNEDGKQLLSSREDTIGEPMKIPEYIEDHLRSDEDYSRLYPSTDKTGSGTSPNIAGSRKPDGQAKIINTDSSNVVSGVPLEKIMSGEVKFEGT